MQWDRLDSKVWVLQGGTAYTATTAWYSTSWTEDSAGEGAVAVSANIDSELFAAADGVAVALAVNSNNASAASTTAVKSIKWWRKDDGR